MAALTEDKDLAESFDFVFIDADKLPYPQYYEFALKLLKEGGVVVLDNIMRRGNTIKHWERTVNAAAEPPVEQEVGNSAVMHGLNLFVKNDDRVNHCLLPIGDGLLVSTKL